MQVHSLKLPRKYKLIPWKQPAQQAFQREFVKKVGTRAKKEKDNFRAITRLETLATQATLKVPKKLLEIF